MRYASVCSGVEAASLAWMPLGWKPVFFSEVEPFPCAVLQQRFDATKPLRPLDPAEASDEKDRKMRESWLKQINKLPNTGTIPNLGDFTKIKGEDYVGTIDVLVGGTPCQDLSVAGKRAGFEGARSSLALDFVRLAYEARCQYFVWENVPGVFSSNRGRDFATLLSMFCGYTVDVPKDGWKSSGIVQNRRPDRYGLAWRVLDAQFTRVPGFPFAVPQRRRRVFLVGCLGDWERSASILLEPDRLSWDTPPRIKTREILAGGAGDRTASAIRMRAGCDGGGKGALIGDNLSHTLQTGNDQAVVEFAEECAGTLEASYYKGVNNWAERTIVSRFWNGEDVAATVTCSSNNALEPDKGRLQAVFTLDADRSNAMKSSNPNSGIHEADVAKTLDATVPTPQKAQGGQMIVGGFIGRQGSGAGSVGYEENVAPTRRSGLTTDVVCFQQNTRDEVRKMNGDGEIAGTLAAEPGMKQQNYLCYDNQTYARNPQDTGSICGTLEAHMGTGGNTVPLIQNAVAIAENIIGRKVENGGNGIGAQDELAYTQNATGVMGVSYRKTVRRLTPLEAERLMSFPDNHTRISWNGKPEEECPDAPRYKACGNSMCVNCMEWIGRRIEEYAK